MLRCINFQLKQLLYLDEYIKISQGAGEGSKKEEIWPLHNHRLNYLSDYLQRKKLTRYLPI